MKSGLRNTNRTQQKATNLLQEQWKCFRESSERKSRAITNQEMLTIQHKTQ
jgi:hypothetical protein